MQPAKEQVQLGLSLVRCFDTAQRRARWNKAGLPVTIEVASEAISRSCVNKASFKGRTGGPKRPEGGPRRSRPCVSVVSATHVNAPRVSSMPAKDSKTGPFRPQEKVLVPHTDKYYEAKVLKANLKEDGVWYYLLHYQGWNKKWDEWVEAPGLAKWNPALVKPEQMLNGKAGGKGLGGQPGKKRRLDELNDEAPVMVPAYTHQTIMDLPQSLREVLLGAHEQIKERGVLPELPSRPCVNDILNLYVEQKRALQDDIEVHEEMASGMRVYFDRALRHLLLYDEERALSSQVLSEGCLPCCVYGGEHLLRLLLKLPDILAGLPHARLQAQLKDIVAFLERNCAYIFNGAKLPAHVLKPKPEAPSVPASTPHAATANGSTEPRPQSAPRYTYEGDDSWED
ncbi:hypothetical protein WJX84_009810 [Apatococcus fuscideae]|uniref:MRG domain-containing protein n=1 Tax=Apatococcus fuscideae TaxID=2026836 RepID=A0AAW1SYW5_9CHLO